MEIGLGGKQEMVSCNLHYRVLILVLVEIGLGGIRSRVTSTCAISLNPCFSGNRFGRFAARLVLVATVVGLNPCFSGNRFGRVVILFRNAIPVIIVLILVLVEIGLGVFDGDDGELHYKVES